jgi:hypothetical protein
LELHENYVQALEHDYLPPVLWILKLLNLQKNEYLIGTFESLLLDGTRLLGTTSKLPLVI